MKVAFKGIDKPVEIIDVKGQYVGDVARKFLGDVTVERVMIDDNFYMYIDEEGKLKNLDSNFFMFTNNPVYPVDVIVGNAVFIRNKEFDLFEEIWDYETDNITEEDLKLIDKVINGFDIFDKIFNYDIDDISEEEIKTFNELMNQINHGSEYD